MNYFKKEKIFYEQKYLLFGLGNKYHRCIDCDFYIDEDLCVANIFYECRDRLNYKELHYSQWIYF